MIAESRKPAIFIGSSVERLEVAYAMQEHLEYTTEPTVWTQDIFKPSRYALIDLERAARNFQFAIFVFAPDDVVIIRGAQSGAIRDNIIFEFGLFVGAIGLARCFLLVPRGSEPLHLPTDLLGLTPLTYAAERSDRNLVAALGPAANRVRRAVREQRAVAEERVKSDAAKPLIAAERSFRFLTAQDYVVLWDSPRFRSDREAVKILPWSPLGYDEEESGFFEALRRLFAFLESFADAVQAGEIDEASVRSTFEQPIRLLWPHMHTSFSPPNQASEWWMPLPKIAELDARWTQQEKQG